MNIGSELLARDLLALLGDAKRVRAGISVRELRSIMVDERGVDEREVQDALGKIREEKWALPKGISPSLAGWSGEVTLVLTPKGKSALRGWRETGQFNVRAPHRLLEELGTVAREGETPSDVALRLMEEGIRMEKFPGVTFRWTPSGRRPYMQGSGLSVWEIFQIHREFEANLERIAKAYPYLKPAAVSVAVNYAREYRSETPVGAWGVKPKFVREFTV